MFLCTFMKVCGTFERFFCPYRPFLRHFDCGFFFDTNMTFTDGRCRTILRPEMEPLADPLFSLTNFFDIHLLPPELSFSFLTAFPSILNGFFFPHEYDLRQGDVKGAEERCRVFIYGALSCFGVLTLYVWEGANTDISGFHVLSI